MLKFEMWHIRKVVFGVRVSIQNYATQYSTEFNVFSFECYVPFDLPVS